MGRIGQAVARRASGFSMKVFYHCRHRLPLKEEKQLHATFLPFDRLLKESDFVSLHLPLTEASYHLIDQAALQKMKSTAVLINTARGAVVDEKALIEALDRKIIAGCGLDVFEEEPFIPARLRKLKQAVLLPHIGSASNETRIRMGLMVFENLSDFFAGKSAKNMVN
jgi:glyoxylate reductase